MLSGPRQLGWERVLLGLNWLLQVHLHCSFLWKCCLAYSLIPFFLSVLLGRILQVSERRKGRVRPHCLGSGGDSSLLQEQCLGCFFGMICDLELSVFHPVAPGGGLEAERQPKQLE